MAIPVRPDSPDASSPRAGSNRGRIAVAGFVCGLVSFVISLAFSVNFVLVYQIFLSYRQSGGLGDVETRLWGGNFGFVVVGLQLATIPLGLAGVVLGVLGWRALSRRRLARSGVALSILALIPSALLITVIFIVLHDCSVNSCI